MAFFLLRYTDDVILCPKTLRPPCLEKPDARICQTRAGKVLKFEFQSANTKGVGRKFLLRAIRYPGPGFRCVTSQ